MPFPEVKRANYKNNPLVEVVCQLRFPSLLRIKRDIPADLQEKIRSHFPNVEELNTVEISIDNAENAPKQTIEKLYNFQSADKFYKFTLSHDFIALTNYKYTKWEDYKKKAEIAFEAFAEAYGVDLFTRVGLRYTNIIRPSTVGGRELAWDEYINPVFSSCFGDKQVTKEFVKNHWGKLLFNLGDEETQLNVGYGLMENSANKEQGFLIDGDVFTKDGIETKGLKNVFTRLGDYKQKSHDFFRWCITEKLHRIMEAENND